jgi:outer membrane protein assembly factor BamB
MRSVKSGLEMNIRSRVAAVVTGVALALSVTVGWAPAASAAYSHDPVGPTWTPDGAVLAAVTAGPRVIVGGNFTGGIAALNASTGALIWRGTANAGVEALALSQGGTHVIVGGRFTEVSGAAHRKLASLRVSDGVAESTWKARAGGTVRDIAIVGDTAYFGGAFTNHNGINQGGLGAVSVSAGTAVTAFTASTDAKVYALATNGSKLVIGGNFTAVNGLPRASLASVTLASNALGGWNPARQCTGCNLYWDVLVNGSTVYAVGRNAGAVVAFDLDTAARRWRVTANGDAQALTFSDGLVYVGGHFTQIGNGTARQPRKILAALNPATGALDANFRPSFVGSYPGVWALASTSSRLYVGGHFSSAGTLKKHPYLAIFGS